VSARSLRLPLLLGSALLFAGPTPDSALAKTGRARVAAVLYTGQGGPLLGCNPGDHACAVEALVRRAANEGAQLVVTPEYALGQGDPEPDPRVGHARPDPLKAPLQLRFSRMADELDLYLVIDLETQRAGKVYNTQLAFDPKGALVAKHHKFELFEGERGLMTPGIDAAAFDTPFGRVGLLICADIYGPPARHERLAADGVDIVAFSSAWTVGRATQWQAAFARDFRVVLVGANGSAGKGRGGGIFDPSGDPLAISQTPVPQVLVADLPAR